MTDKTKRRGRPVQYTEIADYILEVPGGWVNLTGIFGDYKVYRAASDINTGRLRAFAPRGTFEAKVRGGYLYARSIVYPEFD